MLELILFILVCYGFTNIVVYSEILRKVREKLDWYILRCAQCSGFWVGSFVFVLFWISGIRLFTNLPIGIFLFACLSSGTSYFLCQVLNDEGINVKHN